MHSKLNVESEVGSQAADRCDRWRHPNYLYASDSQIAKLNARKSKTVMARGSKLIEGAIFQARGTDTSQVPSFFMVGEATHDKTIR